MNPTQYIKVKCIDFTHDGQGVCVDSENRKYFISALLIGEEAEIEVTQHKKSFDIGKVKRITKFSPYRIEPKCKTATSCGGCVFQNLDYSKELEYKKDTAIKTLNRIGKLELNKDDIKIYGADDPYYYRDKIQVPFGYDKQHRLVYGLYRFKSHNIVPIEECVISDKVHVDILKAIYNLAKYMEIPAYDEVNDTGIIRHVLIRVGKVSKEVMVTVVVRNFDFDEKRFTKELINECPNIKTLVFNENPCRTNVILWKNEKVAYGKGYITDELLGVKFRISSKSFYQINHDQCEKLYSLAFEKAELKASDVILDAYCGIGTIGLTSSKKVKKVVGFEVVDEAIVDAKKNAELNGINNVEFYCLDAKKYDFNNKFDVVFVDPPRKGLDENFISKLIKNRPTKIVYISCDVGTLARDLSILKEYYEIASIDFVDMFPRTPHVESVVLLKSLKN